MSSESVTSGRLRLIAATVVVVCLVGCGTSSEDQPLRAAVMGTVTLDQAVLKSGSIRFIPTDGTTGPQTTAVIVDGIFTLPKTHGPVVGKHRVEIESSDTAGLAMDDEKVLERLHTTRKPVVLDVVAVPPTYNENSQLTAEIPAGGTADLNFELVSKPQRR